MLWLDIIWHDMICHDMEWHDMTWHDDDTSMWHPVLASSLHQIVQRSHLGCTKRVSWVWCVICHNVSSRYHVCHTHDIMITNTWWMSHRSQDHVLWCSHVLHASHICCLNSCVDSMVAVCKVVSPEVRQEIFIPMFERFAKDVGFISWLVWHMYHVYEMMTYGISIHMYKGHDISIMHIDFHHVLMSRPLVGFVMVPLKF